MMKTQNSKVKSRRGLFSRKLENQNYNLKVKTLIFLSLCTFHFALFTSAAIAAESTPSADIRAKLEELKKEIASKAAQIKQEVSHKLKDRAYVGTVKTKSDTTLTLAAASGPKMVSINQDTVFESKIKSKQKFSQKTLSTEDYITALGDTDETGVLTAKKIILLTAPVSLPKTYLWGQIISLSNQLSTLKNNEFKNVAVSLPDSPKVKLNDFVILTGQKDKNNIFTAQFIFVVPQGGSLKPQNTATPSASIAPAPSATVSAKPSKAKKTN